MPMRHLHHGDFASRNLLGRCRHQNFEYVSHDVPPRVDTLLMIVRQRFFTSVPLFLCFYRSGFSRTKTGTGGERSQAQGPRETQEKGAAVDVPKADG
jgi:hypothetical protein